jgi:hypothetical protein
LRKLGGPTSCDRRGNPPRQAFAERFCLVAKVLSEADKRDLIAAKLAHTKSHEPSSHSTSTSSGTPRAR